MISIAPSPDKKHAILILLRQQHVELLAAVLGARALRVSLDQLDELVAVLGFHLELDDDHNSAHQHFLQDRFGFTSVRLITAPRRVPWRGSLLSRIET
jgi:hypothetical protein